MKDTVRHIKEHNLHTKKGKTGGSRKQTPSYDGGSDRIPLTDESVAANLRDVMPPSMQTRGNVKSLEHDGSQEIVIQPSTTRRRGRPTKSMTIAQNRERAKTLLSAVQDKKFAIEDKQVALEDKPVIISKPLYNAF